MPDLDPLKNLACAPPRRTTSVRRLPPLPHHPAALILVESSKKGYRRFLVSIFSFLRLVTHRQGSSDPAEFYAHFRGLSQN